MRNFHISLSIVDKLSKLLLPSTIFKAFFNLTLNINFLYLFPPAIGSKSFFVAADVLFVETYGVCLFLYFQVSLTVQDIETILNTLIFDGKAEMIVVSDGAMSNLEVGMVQRKLYRAIKPLVPVPGLMRVPCGVCPVSTIFCYFFKG